MDFSVIFQLRTKKFWWMDVIFYFVISSLIATVLCYLIFLFKDGMISNQINDASSQLQTVGTLQQKEHEAEVLTYQKKIGDFSVLLKNHEFASNVFAFMQAQTLPNIWFSQFSLDEKNTAVQLSGEADDVDSFSRQVAALEGNKYVKSMGSLNSSLGQAAKLDISIGLVLKPTIFDYLPDIAPASDTTLTTDTTSTTPQSPAIPATTTTAPSTTTNPPATPQQSAGTGLQPASGEKLITSFHLLDPAVSGQIDEVNYKISVAVPYGTDIKNLTPSIVASPGTTLLPASLLSQDFTEPINYKVIAQDGSAQNYQVNVTVSPAVAPTGQKSAQTQSYIMTLLVSVGVVVVIVLASVILLIRRKNKKA